MQVPTKQWVLIAANPKSGAGSARNKVFKLREAIARDGFEVELCESLEQVAASSRQWHRAGCLRAIVSAGGDGTVAAIVNLVPPDVPIVIFPLGTENLLAKHLGLAARVDQVLASLRAGKIHRLDVGLANGRMFLVMLGCGFDADVVQRMHAIRQGHIRRWSYAKPIWDAVRSYEYPEIELEIEPEQACAGEPSEGNSVLQPESGRTVEIQSAAWIFAFNLPRYAANLRFCPQAVDNDGLIDVCTFRRGGFWRAIWYLANVWRGGHQRLPDFRHVRTRKITLRSSARVPYQLDGDPGGVLPVQIEIVPARLCVLIPGE